MKSVPSLHPEKSRDIYYAKYYGLGGGGRWLLKKIKEDLEEKIKGEDKGCKSVELENCNRKISKFGNDFLLLEFVADFQSFFALYILLYSFVFYLIFLVERGGGQEFFGAILYMIP